MHHLLAYFKFEKLAFNAFLSVMYKHEHYDSISVQPFSLYLVDNLMSGAH